MGDEESAACETAAPDTTEPCALRRKALAGRLSLLPKLGLMLGIVLLPG